MRTSAEPSDRRRPVRCARRCAWEPQTMPWRATCRYDESRARASWRIFRRLGTLPERRVRLVPNRSEHDLGLCAVASSGLKPSRTGLRRMRALPTASVCCFSPLPWGRAVRRRSAWLEATAEEWRPIATREEFRLRAPRPTVKRSVLGVQRLLAEPLASSVSVYSVGSHVTVRFAANDLNAANRRRW
jgi:hypothetical protein